MLTTSGLSFLLHGILSLPNVTSCDEISLIITIVSEISVRFFLQITLKDIFEMYENHGWCIIYLHQLTAEIFHDFIGVYVWALFECKVF